MQQCLRGSIAEFHSATKFVDLDEERQAGNNATERLNELRSGCRRATCGKYVVDNQNPLARMDGVTVDLKLVAAVFEAVLLADNGPRKFARLAHRHEACTGSIRNRCTKYEPTCFDPDHMVDRNALELFDHAIDSLSQGSSVAEERRDVSKRHPVDRVVSDIA